MRPRTKADDFEYQIKQLITEFKDQYDITESDEKLAEKLYREYSSELGKALIDFISDGITWEGVG